MMFGVLSLSSTCRPPWQEYSKLIDGSWRRKMASYVMARRVLGTAEEGAGEVSPFVFEDEQEEEAEEEKEGEEGEEEDSDSDIEFVETRKSKRKREEE